MYYIDMYFIYTVFICRFSVFSGSDFTVGCHSKALQGKKNTFRCQLLCHEMKMVKLKNLKSQTQISSHLHEWPHVIQSLIIFQSLVSSFTSSVLSFFNQWETSFPHSSHSDSFWVASSLCFLVLKTCLCCLWKCAICKN